jgi:GTP cyclohydrolase I
MNAPERLSLPDIQSQHDVRNIPINAVGIKGVRYPVTIYDGGREATTVADFTMTVGLPAATKGTHMSRFVELLEARSGVLTQHNFKALLHRTTDKLGADSGAIEMRFPYFITKTAPVSGVQSLLDVETCWRASVSADGQHRFHIRVVVPATSLCPCSKQISRYGAHNQRSHITLDVELLEEMAIEDLIRIAEDSASCEVYGLLKRPDEKYVTERAYDNPKFVEDLVRDVALSLNQDQRVGAYTVEVENFESIHNHSAFASITRSDGKRRASAAAS